MTKAAIIRKATLVRALKAVEEAGVSVIVETTPDGRINFIPIQYAERGNPLIDINSLDEVDEDDEMSF
jgi:hypothetical protein